MPCLVPPHCVVTVTEPQYHSVMHKIAEKYSGEALLSDGNMIWFLCDLAMYNEVYPENAIALPESVEQACVDAIIDDAKDTTFSINDGKKQSQLLYSFVSCCSRGAALKCHP